MLAYHIVSSPVETEEYIKCYSITLLTFISYETIYEIQMVCNLQVFVVSHTASDKLTLLHYCISYILVYYLILLYKANL